MAEQLGQLRQYPRSEAKYKKAIERAPWWTAAWNGLGLLYTQSGDEDKAYATLRTARELDPFNLETTNYMRLLDDMQSFKRVETEHFVFMYDAEKDPILAELRAGVPREHPRAGGRGVQVRAAGEDVHRDLPVARGVQRADDRVAVDRDGRGEHRAGDRAGESSQGRHQHGAVQLGQVLRHEYTHTVTLAATDNRIQHWMDRGAGRAGGADADGGGSGSRCCMRR